MVNIGGRLAGWKYEAVESFHRDSILPKIMFQHARSLWGKEQNFERADHEIREGIKRENLNVLKHGDKKAIHVLGQMLKDFMVIAAVFEALLNRDMREMHDEIVENVSAERDGADVRAEEHELVDMQGKYADFCASFGSAISDVARRHRG